MYVNGYIYILIYIVMYTVDNKLITDRKYQFLHRIK